MSPVTCHQRQQPLPKTLPALTPPLCTVDLFTKLEPKHMTDLKPNENIESGVRCLVVGAWGEMSDYLKSLIKVMGGKKNEELEAETEVEGREYVSAQLAS